MATATGVVALVLRNFVSSSLTSQVTTTIYTGFGNGAMDIIYVDIMTGEKFIGCNIPIAFIGKGGGYDRSLF